MGYTQDLAYHRKYRPVRLADYIGNSQTVGKVLNFLNSGVKPQVILLKGDAGCGKTSLARLIAKEYSCEDRSPFTGACGKCGSCSTFEDYIGTGVDDSLMGVKEVDASNEGGKASINSLIEEALMPMFGGGWRVYIIDECHEMPKASQSRMLKFIEEPPENVLIILCTTDPQKMLDTIMTRCQYIFDIKKPTKADLINLLATVCANEGIAYDAKGLGVVASKTDYVIRQALINLEAVIREKKDASLASVSEVLNVLAEQYFYDFYTYLFENKDILKYVNFIASLKLKSNLGLFILNLIEFTVKGIYCCNGVIDKDLDASEIKAFTRIFSSFSKAEIACLLETLVSIRDSRDIETSLLLLGFSGLKIGEFNVNTSESTEIATVNIADERRETTKNLVSNKTYTEGDRTSLVEDFTTVVEGEDLLQFFAGMTQIEI